MTPRAQLQADIDERIASLQAELAELRSLKLRPGLKLVLSNEIEIRPRADRTREHTILVNDACERLGNKLDLRIAKMSPAGEPTASGRPQHCGPAGLADICGICLMPVAFRGRHRGFGRIFMIEAKTGNARQSKVQIAMMRMVRGLGGFYSVIRSADDAEAAYERCRMGLDS